MMEFVSWDDDIPNMMGKSYKINVPNHQPVHIYIYITYDSVAKNSTTIVDGPNPPTFDG